jgi:two-component system CheB/CheR fusion protein
MRGAGAAESDERAIPVVAIGASAGGIRSLEALLKALPKETGLAFVVVLHLDPTHPSELAAILSNSAGRPVVQVTGPVKLEKDVVYVIAPDRELRIVDDAIDTGPFDEPRGHRAPFDRLLQSLALAHGDGFAVVLSGGGSDGALGVRAVREKGGVVLVQDPEEAEFGSMPRAAISAGADFILPVREIATQLVELAKIKASVSAQTIDGADNEEWIRGIIALLRIRTGQDFAHYKRATFMRRLARRMQVAQTDDLQTYFNYLRDSADEAQCLFNDLLISVTSFFRDAPAFEVLATEVIPRLFDGKTEEHVIRVWVAGCATGEEAYSLAMLLLEEAGRHDRRPGIQVFATDLDAQALSFAREGRYPAAIASDVSEDRLRRFFIREGEQYRIRREVRDLVVFAVHSILRDPPFSRIDLATCRNVLIYLDREVQQQVCAVLHYALNPGAYLLLGNSETAENPPGLFNPVNREFRIFRSVEGPREALPMLPRSLTAVRLPEIPVPAPSRHQTAVDPNFHRVVLEDLMPPSMVVDEAHNVANLSETAGRFLLHPRGPISVEASQIVRPELSLELKAALHRALEDAKPTVTLPIPVHFNGNAARAVVLHVMPVNRPDAPRTALVLFLEGGEADVLNADAAPADDGSGVVGQLREELFATRSLLRTTREQYEGATEELRAANEELQSINEEYRSTAEELETSKEELQSINEELLTVNNELKLKLEMVSRAHNDLQNLISATDVGTMFLDTSLLIQRFTPRVAEIFNVQRGDEGRPVTDFTHKLDYPDLIADAKKVLSDLIPIEHTVSAGGRWYLMRLRPYRTSDDRIDGVVATFVDVTERREMEAEWQSRQKMLLNELSHRVKNTLAVVQAITRQTLQNAVDEDVSKVLNDRLRALAVSHDILVQTEWRGASLDALARQQLAPYLNYLEQISISGPPIILPPSVATPLGLVLHELATNAVKHGSLRSSAGSVRISWTTRVGNQGDERILDLTWSERGVPLSSSATRGTGSGMTLIERAIPNATVTREFEPEGLTCAVQIPLVKK